MTQQTKDLFYEQFKSLMDLRAGRFISASEARARMHGFTTCLYMQGLMTTEEFLEKTEILSNPDFKMFDF